MGGVRGRLAEATSRPPRATLVSKSMRDPPLYQRHGGPALAGAHVRVAPPLADGVGEAAHALLDLPERYRGEGQTQRTLASTVAVESRARRERHPALGGPRQEGGRIHAFGQFDEEREASLGLRPRHALGHAAAERGQERIAPARILAKRARLMPVEQPLTAEVIDGGLDQRARVDIRELLGHLEP